MESKKIRANFHGHVTPDFDSYWLERTKLYDKNLAEYLTDRCIEKGITIYALTSEFFSSKEPFTQTHRRFDYVLDGAGKMSPEYKLEGVDRPVMKISKGDKEVYFLDDQSIYVIEGDEEFKLLTFGGNSLFEEGRDLETTLDYLDKKGFSAIPIYPLGMEGMGEERLKKCCKDRRILAVESNTQLCLPFPCRFLPPIKQINHFNELSKRRDKQNNKNRKKI